MERFVEGREMTVGILDDKPLPVIELRNQRDHFDYAMGSVSVVHREPKERVLRDALGECKWPFDQFGSALKIGLAHDERTAYGCRSVTSAMPTSMNCPPRVWRQ
jgi:hypothetical protein